MVLWTWQLWTDEEKRSIYLQTIAPGVSVAQAALRYTVNANLILKWLRDPKYRPKPGAGSEEVGLRFDRELLNNFADFFVARLIMNSKVGHDLNAGRC